MKKPQVIMTMQEAHRHIASTLAYSSWEFRMSARQIPRLAQNSADAEAKNEAAALQLGMIEEYTATLNVLDTPFKDGRLPGEPEPAKF